MKNPQNKHLKLSKDKKLLGLVGGIAEYFSLDRSLLRIIVLIVIVMSGIIPGFIIYFIIASVIIPDK